MTLSEIEKFQNLNKPRYDFTRFATISKAVHVAPKKQVALLTISRSTAIFNGAAKNQLKQFKFLTFGYYHDQLLLTFMRENSEIMGAVMLAHLGKYSLRAGFKSSADSLKLKTDVINLDAFKYSFKLNMVDKNHAIVDLAEPYNKVNNVKKMGGAK